MTLNWVQPRNQPWIGLWARQMKPFPQRHSSPGAFLVPGPRAVMAACGEFHDPTMLLRYRPLNQPMSRVQTPGGDTARRGSDISRLPLAGQDRTEPAERLCEQSLTSSQSSSSGADCHVADHVQAKSRIITGDIEAVRASWKAPEADTAPSA